MSDLLDQAVNAARRLNPAAQNDIAHAILALTENLSHPSLDISPSGEEPPEEAILALMPTVTPSAVPTNAEVAAWNRLSDHEQMNRLRTLFEHPDCNTVSSHTMEEIVAEARRRSAMRRRG